MISRETAQIIQNPGKFLFQDDLECCSLVFFCKVKQGEKVLDLGTEPASHSDSSGRKNEGWSSHGPGDPGGERGYGRAALYNHLEDRVSIVEGDIKEGGTTVDLASL